MIYLVRHGQTDWTLEDKLQGRQDIMLNETGRQQALETGMKLTDIKFDAIYCSPLSRSKETLKIILENNKFGGVPVFDNRIIERDYGEYEATKRSEFDLFGWKINQNFERAETMTEVEGRVIPFLEEIKRKYKKNNVLIVAHGGVNTVIIAFFEGIPKDNDYAKLVKGTGEFLTFDFL